MATPIAPSSRRYRGMSPDERRQERRRRLLDAGLELFGTVGYSGVSIERLCSTAGVTARHFYQEFQSREAMLAAVADEISQDVLTRVAVAVAAADDTTEARARAGLSAAIEGLLGDPRRARVLLMETSSGVNDVAARRRVLRSFVAIVEAEAARLIALGQIPNRDPHIGATVVISATTELLVEHVAGRGRLSIPDLVEELVRIFLAVSYYDMEKPPTAG